MFRINVIATPCEEGTENFHKVIDLLMRGLLWPKRSERPGDPAEGGVEQDAPEKTVFGGIEYTMTKDGDSTILEMFDEESGMTVKKHL